MSSEPRDQYLAVCDELQRVVAERDALLKQQADDAESLTSAVNTIRKLRAERDALAAQLTGYDAAREMLNVQDNKIDALRAALQIARSAIYSLDAREIYADELASIDAVLANGKP